MAKISAFRALRPQNNLAKEVASLPYDVMNVAEAKQMAAGNPLSFLHVSRAEIDLPDNTDIHSSSVYEKAAENFKKMIADNTLQQDEKACYYLYQQEMNGRKQTGLVACSSVADYYNEVIKKHEFTRPEKEQDRIEHMKAVQAHVGPIFLTFPAQEELTAIFNQYISTQPLYDFTAADGIAHRAWQITNDAHIATITAIFEKDIPYTYIADGHHRTASAARVGKEIAESNPYHTGAESYNFFLSVLFPADQLKIMDYNRLVKTLNGYSISDFLEKLKENFRVYITANNDIQPHELHQISMYLDGQWYLLKAKEHTYTDDPIAVLDVTILQNYVLSPLLGIEDPRTDKNIDFVGGIRGLDELKRRVDSGEMQVAFALYPVAIQQLIAIADSGNVMPPKSTWFEPKLRDGLFSHLF